MQTQNVRMGVLGVPGSPVGLGPSEVMGASGVGLAVMTGAVASGNAMIVSRIV